MSDPIKDDANQPSLTAKDVADYLGGKATTEQTRLIREAMDDPNSQLHEWLKGVEGWARSSLSSGKPDRLGVRNSPAIENLTALLHFIQAKRTERILTDDDFSYIVAKAEIPNFNDLPRTSGQAIVVASRVTSALLDLHPELAEEVAKFGQSRSV
ncbi:MAG: hypothetical protein ABSH22_08100 [Tepidisphaeraceae bacterium]